MRGYVRCHITRDAWYSYYRNVSTTSDRDSATINNLASFMVVNGLAGAQQI
ncbi:MAG: hypothetical protein SAL70_16655 [Scytonema sp. PMC 1070.18]|nr:hypothetical protein [Scytonema sp. PMC 1070.18]